MSDKPNNRSLSDLLAAASSAQSAYDYESAAHGFTGSAPVFDDFTLMILRRSPE